MEDDELNINELFLQPTKTMPSLTAEAETAVANGKKYNTRTQLWDLDQETEYGFGDTFTAMQQEGASIYSMASRSMDVDDGEFDESFSFTEDQYLLCVRPASDVFTLCHRGGISEPQRC